MTNSLHPIKPGDPLRASTVNKLIDGAKSAFKTQRSGLPGHLSGFDATNTVIRTLNTTNTPLPCYAVVAIDAAMFDPNVNKASFLKEPAVRVGQPNTDTQNFAILQQPALLDQVVPACVSGVSIVELDVQSPEHQYAVPNAGHTMTTADSGGAKILWRQEKPGDDGKIWGLVLFPVSAAPTTPDAIPTTPDAITVPVFYSARQWTNKLPINGDENKRLWCESDDPFHSYGTWFMNACGLTDEGKTPLPVMEAVTENDLTTVRQKKDESDNVLYYRDVKLSVKERFIQPDSGETAAWKLVFVGTETDVPPLTEDDWQTTGFVSAYLWLWYLASLEGTSEAPIVDFSDQWETTTDPEEALKIGHQVIAPHTIVGYSLGNECTYRPSENKTIRYTEDDFTFTKSVLVPIIQPEHTFVRIFAEVELDLFEMTEGEQLQDLHGQNTAVVMRKLETIEDFVGVDRECIWAPLPEYQNEKPLVKDTKSIENNCTGKPLLGLWKDGNFPQLLFCENIPYGYCIPLQTITSLIKVSCDDCSPVYNTNKYIVAIEEVADNKFFVPQTVDYKPSIRCD